MEEQTLINIPKLSLYVLETSIFSHQIPTYVNNSSQKNWEYKRKKNQKPNWEYKLFNNQGEHWNFVETK